VQEQNNNMSMSRRNLLLSNPVLVLAQLMLVSGYAAQTPSGEAPVQSARLAARRTPPANWTARSMAPIEQIKGAPYSAQKTIDGVSAGREGGHVPYIRPAFQIYRDSEGRVRKEVPPEPGAKGVRASRAIEIEDAAAGVRIALDEANRIAHRIRVPVRPPAPQGRRSTTALRLVQGPNQPTMKTSDLGSKEFDGIRAQGMRTVVNWPPGTVNGNQKPRVVTTEEWFSRDLKVMIVWKSSDPDSSVNETLTHIERKEPDPALFRIPSDYRIVDDEVQSAIRKDPASAAQLR
jgi:hypothetical protein